MKHKLALFDLDGVRVDTAKYHFISWCKIAKCFNYNINSYKLDIFNLSVKYKQIILLKKLEKFKSQRIFNRNRIHY